MELVFTDNLIPRIIISLKFTLESLTLRTITKVSLPY